MHLTKKLETRVPPKERVTYFIKLVNDLNKRFACPKKAHTHLSQCLLATEIIHQAKFDRMIILPFTDFRLDVDHNIYKRTTVNQTILLHVNGAYGIYYNPTDKELDLMDFFKTGSNCMVRVSNNCGKSLWQT